MFVWLIFAGAFGAIAGWGWSQMHISSDAAPANASLGCNTEDAVHDRIEFEKTITILESESAQLRMRCTELECLNQTINSQSSHQIKEMQEMLTAANDASDTVKCELVAMESNRQTVSVLMANVQNESYRVAQAQLHVMEMLTKMRLEKRVRACLDGLPSQALFADAPVAEVVVENGRTRELESTAG